MAGGGGGVEGDRRGEEGTLAMQAQGLDFELRTMQEERTDSSDLHMCSMEGMCAHANVCACTRACTYIYIHIHSIHNGVPGFICDPWS